MYSIGYRTFLSQVNSIPSLLALRISSQSTTRLRESCTPEAGHPQAKLPLSTIRTRVPNRLCALLISCARAGNFEVNMRTTRNIGRPACLLKVALRGLLRASRYKMDLESMVIGMILLQTAASSLWTAAPRRRLLQQKRRSKVTCEKKMANVS